MIKNIDSITFSAKNNLSLTRPRLSTQNISSKLLLQKDTYTFNGLKSKDFSPLSLIKDLRKQVSEVNLDEVTFYTKPDNKVAVPQHQGLEDSINSFIGAFPEFIGVFKNSQNDRDGLEKHTLKTFQILKENKDYKKLSKKDQTILDFAALFHDLGKIEKNDERHPKRSGEMTKKLLKNQNLDENSKKAITKLTRYHYWNGIMKKRPEKINAYASIFNQKELLMLKILAEVDIKSRPNVETRFLTELNDNYTRQKKAINEYHKMPEAPKDRPEIFRVDNFFRAELAKELKTNPKNLQSVVGANELKYLLKNKFKEENFFPGTNDINVKNGNYQINMHSHTIHSDGSFTPQALLEQVTEYANRIKKPVYFTTSDHNNVNANIDVLKLISKNPEKYKNVRFITGVEVNAKYKGENNQEASYETLVYGFNPFKKELQNLGPMNKQHSPQEIVSFFQGQDVLMSLAHPQRVKTKNMTLKDFVGNVFSKNRGRAMEVFYSYSDVVNAPWAKDYTFNSDEVETNNSKAIAQEFKLLFTGGRDNHGKDFFHRGQKESSK